QSHQGEGCNNRRKASSAMLWASGGPPRGEVRIAASDWWNRSVERHTDNLSIHVLILNSDLCTTLFCAEVLGRCLGSTANVELLENVSHMDADGAGTDVRFFGNLLVGKSSR